MPSDINKCISGNDYKEGSAVTIQPVIAVPSAKINSTRGTSKDWAEFALIVSKKWKIRAYYYNSSIPDNQVVADVHAPATSTAAIITYAADAYGAHVISGVAWSYTAAPTGGNLQIEDGSGNVIFSVDITAAGPGYFAFPDGLKGSVNTAMIITLADGGATTGKVTTFGHTVQ